MTFKIGNLELSKEGYRETRLIGNINAKWSGNIYQPQYIEGRYGPYFRLFDNRGPGRIFEDAAEIRTSVPNAVILPQLIMSAKKMYDRMS